MASNTGIILRNVAKTFTVPDGAVSALQDVSLDICGGEFFCIVGPSGCGKTTLLRILAGLEENSAGDVVITANGGRPLNSMVFQEQSVFPWMSSQEIQTASGGRIPWRRDGHNNP